MPIADCSLRRTRLPDEAVLRVNLDALAANYRLLTALVAPSCCGAVVKADAYGLGMVPVAIRLRREGCAMFFVATVAEGIALRAVLPDPAVSIHVLNGPLPGSEETFVAQGLVPMLNTLAQVRCWASQAQCCGRVLPAVLNLDTGMRRLGLDGDEIQQLRAQPELMRPLAITHVMTHLACADDPEHPENRRQLALFDDWRSGLPAAPTSIGNSAGILLGPSYRGDLVRPGIALYGGNPRASGVEPGLAPVVRLEAPVLQVREIDRIGTVGYGGTYSVRPPARLATIGIGYADGYPRALSNCGAGLIAGQSYPIAGRVSMDLCTLDISAAPAGAIRPGMMATVIGDALTIDAVARQADRVGYEILTGLGARLRREYQSS